MGNPKMIISMLSLYAFTALAMYLPAIYTSTPPSDILLVSDTVYKNESIINFIDEETSTDYMDSPEEEFDTKLNVPVSETVKKRVKRSFIGADQECPRGQKMLPPPLSKCVDLATYVLLFKNICDQLCIRSPERDTSFSTQMYQPASYQPSFNLDFVNKNRHNWFTQLF